MKALTIQQPWAWAVIHGGKDVENRTQLWNHRGPLAIHAGARRSERGEEDPRVIEAVRKAYLPIRVQRPYGLTRWTGDVEKVWPAGAVIGVVDVVGSHYEDTCGGSCSQWAESAADEAHAGREGALVHMVLANPRALRHPILLRGRLGLWNLTSDVVGDIERQLR